MVKEIKYLQTLLVLLSFALALPFSTWNATIIADLGGFLVQKSLLQSMWLVGPTRFVGPFNVFDIERRLFVHLNNLKPRLPTTPAAYYKDKYPLPQIFCDWLAGFISSKELLALTNSYFNQQLNKKNNKRELKLLRAIAHLMFMPSAIAKVIIPCKPGFKLLKQCYQQRIGSQRKHKIYILTNWDSESFPFLYQHKKLRTILNMADGIVVSGLIHLIKPDPAIYLYTFKEFNIDPDNELTIYIDDEMHNINAARNLHKKKLHCIQCKNYNFKKVTKELIKLDVLPA